MKIFCIGRNYVDHAHELGNEVPTVPIIFMKPATALLAEGKPFFHPDFSNDIHYELEIVLKISKNGKSIPPKYASEYYEQISLGIDFTARDLQNQAKAKGLPWEIAKAFDHSAAIGNWVAKASLDVDKLDFALFKNDLLVQSGNTRDLIFSFDEIISYVSNYFTLQVGDLIYTGTPSGVGKISIGDHFEGKLLGVPLLSCKIK